MTTGRLYQRSLRFTQRRPHRPMRAPLPHIMWTNGQCIVVSGGTTAQRHAAHSFARRMNDERIS